MARTNIMNYALEFNASLNIKCLSEINLINNGKLKDNNNNSYKLKKFNNIDTERQLITLKITLKNALIINVIFNVCDSIIFEILTLCHEFLNFF